MSGLNLSQTPKKKPRISPESKERCRTRWATEPDLTREQLASDEGMSYNSLRTIIKGVEKAQPSEAGS